MDISARTRKSLLRLSLLRFTVSDSIPSGVRHGHFGSNSELSSGFALASFNVLRVGAPMPQCLSATNLEIPYLSWNLRPSDGDGDGNG